MKHLTKLKDLALLAAVVFLLWNVRKNVSRMNQLETMVEQNKNNLYQTNQVIAEMQKQNAVSIASSID
tara:strand:+ start:1124 stop:1327 length:204 start_codon:yes stop_codon:yes gene_type:complete